MFPILENMIINCGNEKPGKFAKKPKTSINRTCVHSYSASAEIHYQQQSTLNAFVSMNIISIMSVFNLKSFFAEQIQNCAILMK